MTYRINNKEKQYASKTHCKYDVKLSNPLITDVEINYTIKSKRNNRKCRKNYNHSRSVCPFCEAQLQLQSFGRFSFDTVYKGKCQKCGAHKIKECPCCKSETWVNKSRNCRHQNLIYNNCGFIGKFK